MKKPIPQPVIAAVAELVEQRETHATLESLLMHAGAPGEPPEGNKLAKAMTWLRRANAESAEPLAVLGLVLEPYLDEESEDVDTSWGEEIEAKKAKIRRALSRAGLRYARGGMVVGGLGGPSRSLEVRIRKLDIPSVEEEYARAMENVERKPREALSAACNILEAVFKVIIEDEELEAPRKKDLRRTWAVVRDFLGFDPKAIGDRDLQEILGGMAGVVSGMAAFRTHASSAHGSGRTRYRLEPRHARLAVHAAHTLTLFVLESWQSRDDRKADSA